MSYNDLGCSSGVLNKYAWKKKSQTCASNQAGGGKCHFRVTGESEGALEVELHRDDIQSILLLSYQSTGMQM